jgi:hypothetical protein
LDVFLRGSGKQKFCNFTFWGAPQKGV